MRRRRAAKHLVAVETLNAELASIDGGAQADMAISAAKLLQLIHQLKAVDRQIMLLYLEGESAEQISDVTGFSISNVSTKIHRIKRLLSRQFTEKTGHGIRRLGSLDCSCGVPWFRRRVRVWRDYDAANLVAPGA
jgi:RNA polymerase sigma-70 factor (ECF subfamily)